ncbi:solute carrier family 12 member 9-like [Rhinatrema bivittatum]|uniref:solute carrier family 12 member 9-like n=1 Tax=Rhinatrema bivittatum TaxID=194408 RepID=UPI00112C8CE7|nr:solute carrier family 12 member 9-like [Rhinatrema bivittatum]
MAERSPLLSYRLRGGSLEELEPGPGAPRRTSAFLGGVVPTVLSTGSVVLFLRLGFVVGQSGLYETLGMLAVAYTIIAMAVLSLCAISANDALDSGGVYYMISRALGPAFGGSVGITFFLASVGGSALCVLGFVEAAVDIFGIPPGHSVGGTALQVLPRGYWHELLYGTLLLLVCLLMFLFGANIYAKAALFFFLLIVTALGTVFISFFAMKETVVPLEIINGNVSQLQNGTFTGFRLSTLENNLKPEYEADYTTGSRTSFSVVFAVLFSGCAGAMAGANLSGDLKDPSRSIPRGMISAVIFSCILYNLLSLLIGCSCDRTLLQNDYGFLRDISIWHPFVTTGMCSSTLSAAMNSLIGASRILYALAKDDLFGRLLSPAKATFRGRVPWVAALLSWFPVQLALLSGKLNTIAAVVTIFSLLVYATLHLACLALERASAPDFRPTFRNLTWYTCVSGILGCGAMMFVINPVCAASSVAFLLILLLALHCTSPSSGRGSVSQAPIFHQAPYWNETAVVHQTISGANHLRLVLQIKDIPRALRYHQSEQKKN